MIVVCLQCKYGVNTGEKMAGLKCKQIKTTKRCFGISPMNISSASFACLSVIYVLIVLSPLGYVRAEHHCNHQHPKADEV